jgi:GDPmannose 4,6-dehydratase
MKKALITGALGQDGSYLSEHLLQLGYEVWGTARMQPRFSINYNKDVHYEYADLTNQVSLIKVLQKSRPDEVYNLGGQVFVPTSWIRPVDTFDVNVGGLARILDCLDQMQMTETKVYQASTSEMFGNVLSDSTVVSLNEKSAMNPASPYGVSKLAAHKLVDVYRQKGRFVVSGILGNHESPRRGTEMVTRKITKHVAYWVIGKMEELRLGTTTAKRDWGFAGDYVRAMHLMLQAATPSDYTIGTGIAHSVMEFITTALECAGLEDMNISSVMKADCPEFGRRSEVHTLIIDSSRAEKELGWKPEYSFKSLVSMMLDAEVRSLDGWEKSYV